MSLFERKCTVCKAPIVGRKDRKTCSDRCRTALNRAESRSAAVAREAGAVTGATWATDEPTDELGHWMHEEPSIWR